ncbi:MAG: hypothetical protein A3A96_00795 [Candidatus Zambryskibacteria bacterium RIFCSPLOWO2_01_FULL_39_39]|uniref:Uncharacterized protein n=1 Tax=Candidatus Zambryskibacteria bacterium RIFCSPLOWO2_01_FULL_39_39 TaxID=1802758 RepID=A0A1G2TY18_9BACT|nr:MAG: hypothetical protein A3B88_00600 [Candidatus Zambryskibacteria bacterium RIFCSPHIGHO2_02_FULL_39_19]OHB02205.1 MAG: hypothetical protein A3A96_00795 [Candidatus Zambryskibacteria bacterium RIFCSPLOWO2_01_FULL_39_39]
MIFFAGHHNAGKSTAAKYLKERYGFIHVETSSIVKAVHQQVAPHLNLNEWAESIFHNFDPCIAEEICRERAKILTDCNLTPDIIVTGNRQVCGIQYVMEHVPPFPGTEHVVVYIDTPERLLYERHLNRPDRPGSRLNFNEFRESLLAFDRKMGVEEIKKIASVIVVNNGTESRFLQEMTGALRRKGYTLPEGRVKGEYEN